MQYPKPTMSITELKKLGFSKDFLYRMAHRKGQTYCTRMAGKNTKLIFDTEKFEKERQKLLAR